MIKIHVVRTDGTYQKLVSRGHAEYDEEGHDVVCAAVSALLINTANSLEQLTEDALFIEEGAEGGYLLLAFPEGVSKEGRLLMDSLMLGLHSIAETYGEDFLQIEETRQETNRE